MAKGRKLISLIFSFIVFALFIGDVSAQRRCADGSETQRGPKVNVLPDRFKMPDDILNESSRIAFVNNEWPSSRRGDSWLVVSDRPANLLYDKPNGRSTGIKLDFNEYAWVVGERKEWLEVVSGARLAGNRVMLCPESKRGWIKKEHLLLWNHCMVDQSTQISKKAFLLNEINQMEKLINSGQTTIVGVFDGPSSTSQISTRNLYEVFFIYKREGNRLLLGVNNSFIPGELASGALIGWVDQYRVVNWNQRLALEPNWEEREFEKRKSNPNSRIRGYRDATSADLVSKTGEVERYSDKVLWDNDPVGLPSSMMSPDNPRRTNGEVFRFPVFKMNKDGYIESGALARIPTRNSQGGMSGMANESTLIQMKENAKKWRNKRDNINIYFLVEATRDLQAFRSAIIQAIEAVDLSGYREMNVRYGLAVYRDAELRQEDTHFKMTRLTNRKSDIIDFLNQQVFDQGRNNDSWTNFRWSLNELLLRGNFPADQHNMVFVIGSHADLSFNRARARTAREEDLIIEEKYRRLEERIAELSINLTFLQLTNSEGNVYTRFAEEGRALMVNNTLKKYAEYDPVLMANFSPPPPNVPDLENKNQLEVNGVTWGLIRRPPRGGILKGSEIVESVWHSIESQYIRNDSAYQTFKKLGDGEALSSDIGESFAALVWADIDDMIKNSKLNQNAIENLMDEKIRFYNQIYLPVNIPGLSHPYKTVVFMPSTELHQYTMKLTSLRDNLTNPDQTRSRLYEVVVEQMRQLTGNRLSQREDRKSVV